MDAEYGQTHEERYRRHWRLRVRECILVDVIERSEDDHRAVDDMLAMLRPGGKLMITVPASMKLRDRHDVINRHCRRRC